MEANTGDNGACNAAPLQIYMECPSDQAMCNGAFLASRTGQHFGDSENARQSARDCR
jgi:hypothetical protein